MKKAILIFFLVIVIVAGGLITLLITYVDQETVKNKMIQLVREKTDRELVIKGGMQWKFFPWLGVKVQDVAVSNASDFKAGEFAKAEEIDVNVKLLPLIFKQQVEVGHLTLKGVNVLWHDQNGKEVVAINQLNLSCKNVSFNKPFDIKTDFYLQQPNSSWRSEIKLDTQVKLDLANKIYALQDLKLAGELKEQKLNQSYDFDGEANVELNLSKQTLVATGLKLNLAGTKTTGALRCSNILDNPQYTGSLTVNSSDAQVLLRFMGWEKQLRSWSNALLQVDLTVAPPKTAVTVFDYLRATKLSGNIKIDAVRTNKISVSNFAAKIVGGGGVISCQNITLGLYQGSVNGNIDIDVRNAVPRINLKLKLANLMLQPLLIDVADYGKFNGVLGLNTDLSARGSSGEAMLNTLNGNGSISINNGSYQGIDIPYEVRRASALLNQKTVPQESKPSHTNFNSLTASFKINNSLLNTNDFLVQAPDYKVTGQGSTNIAAEQLDLKLQAYSIHDENFFVPIKIYGAFANPTIRPDVAVLAQQVVKKEIKEQVGNVLEKLNVSKDIVNNILPLDKLLPK